jgi:CRISPR-associated endonuclease/helicase Cas3
MTAADFRAFYQAVHDYPPFPWQERLLDTVLSEGWPDPIGLPTSSGKTSAIDVAVFHLALEAGKNALQRRAALRMFFVIDRRVVVDEAAEHATDLARKLIHSDQEIVRSVADSLLSFGAKVPLDVAILRGGMYRDNTWVDEPNQPLVCVSTVDQVGSRLLFRGYQVSDSAKPVHAAMVGNDSLIIVDEAHLSSEFLDTVKAVAARHGGERQVSSGIRLVRMSATIEPAETPFELGPEDYANEILGPRLTASKPTELRSPAPGFETALANAAKQLSAMPNVSVIGVVVNTVAVARTVFQELKGVKGAEAVLLIGRNRPFCAQQLWEEYKDRIAAKRDRPPLDHCLFVVATQTVEVGANIDFDALVSESAPIDALRQRFGRLNRLGLRPESHAILVRRPKEDPVYGDATATTWDFLSGLAAVDFGVTAMQALDLDELRKDAEAGPLVFPQYLEMWAQTNPPPDPDPDVAPFLHGKDALEDADIQVVWREDIVEEAKAQEWQRLVELAPPLSLESLPISLGALRRWLRGETKLNVSDIEGVAGMEDDARKESKQVLIWGRQKNNELLTKAGDIRPGDVVVVPASYGGCDRFGWHPGSHEQVEDIGDKANNLMADMGLRRHRLRLQVLSRNPADRSQRLREALTALLKEKDDDDLRKQLIDQLQEEFKGFPGRPRIDESGNVALWPIRKPKSSQGISLMKPEDQDDHSAGLEKPITLSAHTEGVVERTRKYAVGCGLTTELIDDLVLAAELHDLGKWDERFQFLLRLCAPRDAARLQEPLAKSGGRLTIAERQLAQQRARYPRGARHESGSVSLAIDSGELDRANDSELVTHLIGAHHGFGRPLLPFWDDNEDANITAEYSGKQLTSSTGRYLARFDSGWADEFSILNHRYGYWGLAYLEAILRRADCVQSREEQEQDV